jgi:KDO2-lipid IV(A) lauroyltransferase
MKGAPALHALEYALFLAVKATLRLLPHEAARRLGRGLGWVGHRVDVRHRRIARRNFALAFPELSAADHRRMTRECFANFGLAICDALSARRFDLEELCRRMDIEGWEHLQTADRGQGVLVMSAHLGLWETAAYPPGIYGGPLYVVGRPLDNPRLDAELIRTRRKFGNELISKHGAARPILKTLAAGGRVGILIDQRARPKEGISVPFFGLPAHTNPILARLSRRTGAPVVPIYGYPLPKGRYRVVLRPAIEPTSVDELKDEEEAVAELTRRYLQNVEEEIRRQPELWLWMHDRWRGVGSVQV